jgi:hypothetical protein
MVFAKSYLPFLPFTETLVTKFVKRYQLCVLCNNKQLLPSMDVNNPLKAITVLLYRTTDQGLGI